MKETLGHNSLLKKIKISTNNLGPEGHLKSSTFHNINCPKSVLQHQEVPTVINREVLLEGRAERAICDQ